MAKIYSKTYIAYIDEDDFFNLVGNEHMVFGSGGSRDYVRIRGNKDNILDQNIEKVEFQGSIDDYSFKQTGNIVNVYSGNTLVCRIAVQDDADGTLMTFTEGTLNCKIGSGGLMTLGGVTLAPEAVKLTPPPPTYRHNA